MAQTGAERQKRLRVKKDKARAEIERRLALAERPTLRSDPVFLLEGLLDGVLEIAWRINERDCVFGSYADRNAFRSGILKMPDLPDVLGRFEPYVEQDTLPDFRCARICIRQVYTTAKRCTSFATQ